MRTPRRASIVSASGLCLLGALIVLTRIGPAAPVGQIAAPYVPRHLVPPFARADRINPTDQALREAVGWESHAIQASYDDLEALKAWDPQATMGRDTEVRWQLLASDRAGSLRAALTFAQRAAALAGSPDEAGRVARFRARLERDLGRRVTAERATDAATTASVSRKRIAERELR